jgi:hypothetical protein
MTIYYQTFASTNSNFFVIKYAFIPYKSNQLNFQTCPIFSPLLAHLSSNFKLAPWIIKYRIISHFPYNIYIYSVILNVYNAIYKGQRCYFKHLHSRVDFFIIYFINYMHDLYWELDEPFFWLTRAVLVMNRLKQLMNFPFYNSKIALGLAPASSIFFAVSKSSFTIE